jgi:hypothetical protein
MERWHLRPARAADAERWAAAQALARVRATAILGLGEPSCRPFSDAQLPTPVRIAGKAFRMFTEKCPPGVRHYVPAGRNLETD